MRESEKWRLVAEKVAEGFEWHDAVVEVFTWHVSRDWNRGVTPGEHKSSKAMYLYALLLAEDAADEEATGGEVLYIGPSEPFDMGTASTVGFTPVHITYCAEDPPMPAVFVGPEPEQDEPEVSLGNYPVDRRRTWGEKVAQGLRKWADWAEARF